MMSAMVSDGRKRALTAVGFAALTLVWGTQFLVIKHGQVCLPPLLTAALRFAVLTAAAQVAVIVSRSRAPAGRWRQRLMFGVAQALSFGLLYWAQGHLASALAGVLSATGPLVVAVLAHRFIPGERLTLRRSVALLLGFTGVSLIVWATRPSQGTVATLAVVAILLGETASAANKVLGKQLTAQTPAPVLLRDMGLVVTVCTGLAALVFERERPMDFSPAAVLAFVYLGLVASFAASGLYLVLLRRFAVSSMSYLQFTTAVVAAGAGVLVGGEQLAASAAVGAMGVLAGLFLIAPRAPAQVASARQ